MTCKKCGIDLSGKEFRNVAQWPFCLDCFQALMEKAEAKKDELAETSAVRQEPPGEQQRCLVCEKDIEKGSGREMLGLTFCQECYENLVRRPVIKPRAETGEKEQALNPLEKQAVAQVRVDLKSPVQCHSCNRQIPAIASKSFDGHSYCPDCYYALPEIKAKKPKPFPKMAAAQPSSDEEADAGAEENGGGLRCQTCRRQVLPVNLKTVEGFEICLACLTADREMALDIARKQQRKAMEKIKKELSD